MAEEKALINELLLVSSYLGNKVDGKFVRDNECLEWLQDLLRAIRQDTLVARKYLMAINVPRTKLAPLLLCSRNDPAFVLVLLKIGVVLSMPLSRASEDSLNLPMILCKTELSARNTTQEEHVARRSCALEQTKALQDIKTAFCNVEIFYILLNELKGPLGITSNTSRTDSEELYLELILTFIRNLLKIKNKHGPGAQEDSTMLSLVDGLMLEVFLYIVRNIGDHQNAKLNLLMLDILESVVSHQNPACCAQNFALKEVKLKDILAREQSIRCLKYISQPIKSRHSHFGTNIKLRNDAIEKTARKNCNTLDFKVKNAPIGGNRPHHLTGIQEFCSEFLEAGYAPFFRSVKEEFRRDSSRVQSEDKSIFFRLATFFMKVQRFGFINSKEKESKYKIDQVLETMDKMCFSLAINDIESVVSSPTTMMNWKKLADALAFLTELMHVLGILSRSELKSHRVLSLGLLQNIFYAKENIDQLQQVLKLWNPVKHGRDYTAKLVELVHVTLQALEPWEDVSDGEIESEPNPAVRNAYLLAKAFDLETYFFQLVTNQTVRMYSTLLRDFTDNDSSTNMQITSFFVRMCKSSTVRARKRRRNDNSEDYAATLEPMLYNFYTLASFALVLSSPHVKVASKFGDSKVLFDLEKFSSSVVRHFSKLCQKNRLACVEALFQHQHPRSFVEDLESCYGSTAYQPDEVIPHAECESHDGITSENVVDFLPSIQNESGLQEEEEEWNEVIDETTTKTVTKITSIRKRKTKRLNKPINLDIENNMNSEVDNLHDGSNDIPPLKLRKLRKTNAMTESEDDFGSSSDLGGHARVIYDNESDE